MKRLLTALVLLPSLLTSSAQNGLPLSFEEALQRMKQGNRSLQLADKEIENAHAERAKLRAWWYPTLQSTGAYVHLSEPVEVRQPLTPYTEAAKEWVENVLPDNQAISNLLEQLGSYTLTFPLMPRNLTTVGLSAEWVVFSGGKRIQASKLGNLMVELAREGRIQTEAAQRILLTENYYGLRLAKEAVAVRRETYENLKRHYEDALRLEAVGMIDKAARLFTQVNMEEAERELEAAEREVNVLQSSLHTLLNLTDTIDIDPTTPLFMDEQLPPKVHYRQAMQVSNPTLNSLRLQTSMAERQLRIEQSDYLPDVVLFAKQTFYSHGIASNLMPHTWIGIGFTWNLFDGMAREQRIRQARITRQSLNLGREKAKEDLKIAIDKLYSVLQRAQDDVHTLHTTIGLSEELLRMRRKSFAEGMATATEVVDAETMLSKARLARLAAYYEYDVALEQLRAICGE